MKKTIFMVTLFTSLSSFAGDYLCVGLDNGIFSGTVNNDVVEIGTLEGAPVKLIDQGEIISLSIKQGNLITAVVAKGGIIGFHQNNGEKAYGVNCTLVK